MSKFVDTRPYATPEAAAKRLIEICREVEPKQDGRIHIEKINQQFLFRDRGSAAEYWAGLELLRDRQAIFYHESGTFIRLLEGADSLLA